MGTREIATSPDFGSLAALQMPSPDHFAVRVLRELDRRNISITLLGEMTGIDRTVLSKWLNGRRSIWLSDAIKIAEALGLECNCS